jgi:hypothetical protein
VISHALRGHILTSLWERESHTDLAALPGLELAGYFSCLLKLKFAGFVTDDGQGLRIDHSAIRAADAGDGAPNAKQLTRGFERRGRDAACVAMQVPLDALDAVLHGLSLTSNVDGLLITMPHKATMFERCGTSSERAKALGAVSVARRNQDGSWHGDMLDGLAFVKAQKDAGATPERARALLVGAGSAGGPLRSLCWGRVSANW